MYLEAETVEIFDRLKNFLAPMDEELIFDDGYAKAEDVAASASTATAQQSVSSQQVVGGSSVDSIDTNPFAQAAINRQNMKLVVNNKEREMHIQIYTPQNFDSVSEIADALKSKRSAIVNYERVELAEQRRICDFLNGVCYVQDGDVRRVTSTMVLYVPDCVEIDEIKSVAPDAAPIKF